MSNTYYLAQIIEDINNNLFSDDAFAFVGMFTTRKNAEDAICDILSKRYDKVIHYTDYSAEADFLDEHSDEYLIDKIEVNKSYY